RQWGSCAVAGGVIGATAGGGTGRVTVNNAGGDPGNGERGGALARGNVGGGLVRALLRPPILGSREGTPPPPPAPPPPPPPPAPPPPPPPPAKHEPLVTLHGPQFDFNKSTLKPEGKRMVDDAVKVMKEKPDLKVSVEGHTDSVGSVAYNQKLSERRANSVRDYM